MANRIIAMIATAQKNIDDKLAAGRVTQEQLDKTHKELDMPMDEYANFQTRKSLASQDGTLTLEEAQTVYQYLGNTPSHFNKQPAAVKIVLTKLYAELLSRSLARR